ncbi:DUF6065 family protein [Niveispirillum fermenti]|uniref:DUF6065 family protein n=1 Tax=Niveispirillum fermenti TaxID=1233113 RepID=UPI003A87FC75
MKLICYAIHGDPPLIRPAPATRDWMDGTPQAYAYRCLPLNIANAHGWELLNRSGFTAHWDGGSGIDSISITPDPGTTAPAISHFGSGVLTFHIEAVFRTEPGWSLCAQGPVNRPKDGISALSGIIETDWAPYSFTMNWKFTAPGRTVRFDAMEPFCTIFPVQRRLLESVEPEIRNLSDDPELARRFEDWAQGRTRFNEELSQPGSDARTAKWQKSYYLGLLPDGSPADPDHLVKLRPPGFVDKR